MNILLAFILIVFIVFIGIIPFILLYPFSNFIAFLMHRIFGYRKKVILGNLKRSFPDQFEEDRNKMLVPIYKNLTDIIIEGIKSFTMRKGQIVRRHKILNPEMFQTYVENKQSVIAVTAHYNNWEWGSLSASLQMDHKVVGFYKPLSNPWVDRFLKWSRSRSGTTLASIKETSKTFDDFSGQPTIFLMAADQNPAKAKNTYWVDFLGQKTAFLHGPEKHAKRLNLPIVYIDIIRKKRGFYTIFLTEIIKNPSEYDEGEITQVYATKVEEMIRRYPPNWLWSHRRWKHKPPQHTSTELV
jgi:KDO2-lipid IV(A) lauroyltransferase